VFGSDNVTIASASATFSDKNVGSAKPVAIGGVTLGSDAGNYTMGALPLDITANITPATISVTLASRTYNNSAAGTFDGAVLHGVLSGGRWTRYRWRPANPPPMPTRTLASPSW
jgi:hypothetical protein